MRRSFAFEIDHKFIAYLRTIILHKTDAEFPKHKILVIHCIFTRSSIGCFIFLNFFFAAFFSTFSIRLGKIEFSYMYAEAHIHTKPIQIVFRRLSNVLINRAAETGCTMQTKKKI